MALSVCKWEAVDLLLVGHRCWRLLDVLLNTCESWWWFEDQAFESIKSDLASGVCQLTMHACRWDHVQSFVLWKPTAVGASVDDACVQVGVSGPSLSCDWHQRGRDDQQKRISTGKMQLSCSLLHCLCLRGRWLVRRKCYVPRYSALIQTGQIHSSRFRPKEFPYVLQKMSLSDQKSSETASSEKWWN